MKVHKKGPHIRLDLLAQAILRQPAPTKRPRGTRRGLPLLPPGPDGVRKLPLRGLSPQHRTGASPQEKKGLTRTFDLAIADCEFRAPLPPRLVRPNLFEMRSHGHNEEQVHARLIEQNGGEGGIRTHEAGSLLTRSPGERLRPSQPPLRTADIGDQAKLSVAQISIPLCKR